MGYTGAQFLVRNGSGTDTPRAAGAWLALGVGLICLLTAGGSMTTTDAVIAYDVTKALVGRGSVALGDESPHYEAYRGRGGRYYSPFDIAQSVWNMPFYAAGRAAAKTIGGRLGAGDTLPKAAVALATVPAVALLAWVCFALLHRLGAEPRRAAWTTLLLVFGTPLWPYSGFGFNQPLTALFLWAAVLAAVAGRERRSALVVSGVFAGLAVLTRHEMLLGAALLGAWILWAARAARVPAAVRFAAGLLPPLAIWGALNWWRFGNPLESGYLRDTTPGIGFSIVAGVAGLLFSPYASLLLYAPVVVLAAAGLPALWRRDRQVAGIFAALFLVYLGLYASLANWMGGRSYGPRYLVPFLPSLVLPLAFWTPARKAWTAAAAIVAVSIAVQVPGVLVDYSKVRMGRAAAGETVAQDRRWSAAPLLLNARASVANTARAVRFLAGLDARPAVDAASAPLSQSLSFSLDLWWMYLAYLGAIGRVAAVAIAGALAAGGALSLRRALSLASGGRRPPFVGEST